MKWHKFDPNFWDSETCSILESRFGEKGILIYLRIMSRIGLEIQTAYHVEYAHDFGWEKSLKDWARVAKYRGDSVLRVLQCLHTLDKLLLTEDSSSGEIRINLKFKNLREFVHKDALSSNERKKLAAIPGPPAGGLLARTDKIRRENPPLPPIGNFPKSGPSSFERTENARRQKELAKRILETNSADRLGPLAGPPTALDGVGEGSA